VFLVTDGTQYGLVQSHVKVKEDKDKGHTLDTVPISEETSLQKHSGMARIVEGFHSFIYTPMHLSTWTIPVFAFVVEAGPHLQTPEESKT